MIKKLILLGGLSMVCTSCSQFALLSSAGGVALSQNSYAKFYNGIDILSIVSTEKSIKNHIYDKVKTNLYKRALETLRRPR